MPAPSAVVGAEPDAEENGEAMQAYILRRLALFPIFLIAVSIVTFIVVRAIPGDAALVNMGIGNANCAECRAAVRRELGLNKPLPVQYGIWIEHAIHGDFGNSTTNKRPIAPEVKMRAWNTLQLAVAGMLLTVLIGVPLGALSAIKRGTVFDYAARFFAIIGLSVPDFWIGTLAVLLPAIWWGWTPAKAWVGFTDHPVEHFGLLILPALTLGISSAAYVSRIVRSSMLEVLFSDYVRTARAKGLAGRRVIVAHVMRNSMLTVITILGLQFGILLSGAIVVETIFGVPGLGQMAVNAVVARDFQTVQALTVIFAFAFIAVQLLVDITYAWVDPRIRY